MFIKVHDKTRGLYAILLRLDDIVSVMPLDGNRSRICLSCPGENHTVQFVDCYESVDEIEELISKE